MAQNLETQEMIFIWHAIAHVWNVRAIYSEAEGCDEKRICEKRDDRPEAEGAPSEEAEGFVKLNVRWLMHLSMTGLIETPP